MIFKITLNVDAIIARAKARLAREAELRRRGVAIFRDWWKRAQARKGRRR